MEANGSGWKREETSEEAESMTYGSILDRWSSSAIRLAIYQAA